MSMSNIEMFALNSNDEMKCWGEEECGPEGCTLVMWPESQDYMDEDWFDQEAYLDITDKYGGSAYWIPDHRLSDGQEEKTA